jgi:hypothetical protein
MPGINNYIIVTVVNALNEKPTNFFDTASTISVAALNSIKAGTTGNYHAKSDIQKQAYNPEMVKTIRAAYGITGTSFNTHTPYVNGKQIALDRAIPPNTEIVLIKNDITPRAALISASRHSLIPGRVNPSLPGNFSTDSTVNNSE